MNAYFIILFYNFQVGFFLKKPKLFFCPRSLPMVTYEKKIGYRCQGRVGAPPPGLGGGHPLDIDTDHAVAKGPIRPL